MERQLLLVDDEENIVRSLVRLLRRDGYTIHTANSGKEGLELLKHESVGVILSDQRMPEMCGVEFLSKAKELCPDTIRMVLSGYTDLNSVTDAINRGAIYKFLTKPWDDDLIRENINQAFQQYELVSENLRLNSELKTSNQELAELSERMSRYANINLHALQISQEVLEYLPIGIVGVGDDGVVALANSMAQKILNPASGAMVGLPVDMVVPVEAHQCYKTFISDGHDISGHVEVEHYGLVKVIVNKIGKGSQAKGTVIILVPKEE